MIFIIASTKNMKVNIESITLIILCFVESGSFRGLSIPIRIELRMIVINMKFSNNFEYYLLLLDEFLRILARETKVLCLSTKLIEPLVKSFVDF